MSPDAGDPRDATAATRAHQRAVLDALPFADVQDFEYAGRGFVATLPEVSVRNASPERRGTETRPPGPGLSARPAPRPHGPRLVGVLAVVRGDLDSKRPI